MKTISGCFNRICKKKYSSLGFYRCSSLGLYRSNPTFVRISNDVIQAFALKRYSYGSRCSVEFGIFPLCLPQPVFFFAGGYMLDQFIVELYEKNSGWIFDVNSDDSITDCVNSISQAIDSYLIPFFDACVDCKSSLSGLIKLEEILEKNRQQVLQLMGISDSAVPWQERSLFDYRKFFMALKLHDFGYARQYLNYQVEFCENKIRSFNIPNSSKQPISVIEGFQAQLSLHLKYLELIEAGDFAFFDEMLLDNETQMKNMMKC